MSGRKLGFWERVGKVAQGIELDASAFADSLNPFKGPISTFQKSLRANKLYIEAITGKSLDEEKDKEK